ncbi:hypothetical protein PaG_00755 [Moesziomyces aphidis]|uniref:Uncharacterized protein n=1 Tax=Moesziomyces aphidis TaxID=84754 RepID=W3VVK7_MOEAP|nr:hypothetical protein PaG_00755 [Moesziomyces aphidis]
MDLSSSLGMSSSSHPLWELVRFFPAAHTASAGPLELGNPTTPPSTQMWAWARKRIHGLVGLLCFGEACWVHALGTLQLL